MLKHMQGWLGSIPISTPLERRQAGLFQIFLLIILGGCLIGLPTTLLVSPDGSAALLVLITYSLVSIWNAGALFLLRRGYFISAVKLAIVGQILALGFVLIAIGLQRSQAVLVAFSVPIALGGILLGRSGTLLAVALSCAFAAIASVLEAVAPSLVGFLPTAVSSSILTISFILIAAVLGWVFAPRSPRRSSRSASISPLSPPILTSRRRSRRSWRRAPTIGRMATFARRSAMSDEDMAIDSSSPIASC